MLSVNIIFYKKKRKRTKKNGKTTPNP